MTDGAGCGRATVGSTVFIFVSLMSTKGKLVVAGRFGMRKLCSLPVVGFKITGNDGVKSAGGRQPKSQDCVCVSFYHPANFLNILSLHRKVLSVALREF